VLFTHTLLYVFYMKCECIMNAGHRMAQRADYSSTTGLHTVRPLSTCSSSSDLGLISASALWSLRLFQSFYCNNILILLLEMAQKQSQSLIFAVQQLRPTQLILVFDVLKAKLQQMLCSVNKAV